VPPAMIFPRVVFKQHMLNGCYPGTLGLATKSGWMTSDLFLEVMKHFVKHTASSKENPSLLLLDNHESHLNIASLDYAKKHGVTLLTFPPHTTHKLQVLDVVLMGPFKTYYNSAVTTWMRLNPGIPFSIYNVASCVNEAYARAMTPQNIISGFRKTGIFPYNPEVFTDEDYLLSSVTDRPNPTDQESEPTEQALPETQEPIFDQLHPIPDLEMLDFEEQGIPSEDTSFEEQSGEDLGVREIEGSDNSVPNSSGLPEESSPPTTRKFIGPEVFIGYPKAKPRKNNRQREKKGAIIATDTPEKEKIRSKKTAIEEKKAAASARKAAVAAKKNAPAPKKTAVGPEKQKSAVGLKKQRTPIEAKKPKQAGQPKTKTVNESETAVAKKKKRKPVQRSLIFED